MKFKGYRKIFIIGMSIIFLCSGLVSCGEAQIQEKSASSSVIEPTSTLSNGVHRYPFAKIGWSTSALLQILDSVGIIAKLLHLSGIGLGGIIGLDITFGVKLKVIEGTVTISPLIGPIVELKPGDTFQFHLLLNNMKNDKEGWISASVFMVTVETP